MTPMSDDPHFKNFTALVQAAVAKAGNYKTRAQKAELKEHLRIKMGELLKAEDDFRLELIQSEYCRHGYEGFLDYIVEVRKNILQSRPFFRERQTLFTAEISPALKDRNWRKIMRYRVNFQFISFVMSTVKPPAGHRLHQLFDTIKELRNHLVEMNLPLVINRAKIFYRKTPKSHLTFMDQIQTASEGMIAGIDKFTPSENYDWSSVVGVGIGRITGLLIEGLNQTQLHFYPSDRRKIYRANKYMSRHPHGVDLAAVADSVNDNAKPGQFTDADEVKRLISAAYTVSADTRCGEEVNAPSSVRNFVSPVETQPDYCYEQEEALAVMMRAVAKLPLVDQKILKMRNVGQ